MGSWRRGRREGGVFRQEKEDAEVKHPRKDQEGSLGLSLDKAQGVWHWDCALCDSGLGSEQKKRLLFNPSCTRRQCGLL